MTADASSSEALVGAVLSGRFRLVKLLGEGGMGAVYEADGLRGEGKRAIKVLHPEYVREPEIVGRFLNESHAARSLNHPNVARIFEAAEAEDGTPYLVMELLVGAPLLAYLSSGNPMPVPQATPIVYAILQALGAAHAGGIVHRDLKPENVFLARDAGGQMTVKVLDFGIAKVMDAAGGMGSKTRTGALLGTPAYMSPEQIRSAKSVDPRSDLWSAGVLFYEMISATQPFQAPSEIARLTAVLTQEPMPIDRTAPQLAPWAPFFRRALAKNPDERFQSAAEMAQALSAIAHGGAMPQPSAPPRAATQAMDAFPPSIAGPGSAAASVPLPLVAPAASSPAGAASLGFAPVAPAPAGSTRHSASGPNPTHVSHQKPPGTPTLSSPPPRIDVIDAPRRPSSLPLWMAFVIAGACLTVGFVAGYLAG